MNKIKDRQSVTYLKWLLKFSLSNPIFYITGIIFTVFVSINFYIRQRFFTGYGSTDLLLFFSAIPYASIIAIPALCYKNYDSIYTNFVPINSLKKILLRYVSILIQYSIFILCLFPAILLINIFGDIDYGQFIISSISLILYGSAIISVSLFIQELIESSVISFVVSAIILAIFNSIHILISYTALNHFFTTIIKNISFIWHFDAAGKGIIDTRDFIWFIISSFIFLFSAYIVKEKKCGIKFSKIQKINLSGVYVLLILIIFNGMNWYTRIDFSKTKTYSLSNYSKNLLQSVDSQLKITYYRSNSLARIYPQVRDVSDYLLTFSNQNKNITFITDNPEKNDTTKKMLEDIGVIAQPFVNVTKSSTEYTNVYSAIVIEYNGNYEVIPYILSTDTLEYDLDGRINHLINGTERTINIIVGNGMSLTEDYSYVVPWLSSQGFICNPLFINDENFIYQLENTSGPLLVFGDSSVKIDQAVAIENYILSEKGNALFAVSPYSANLTTDWSLKLNYTGHLVDMLENWGITFTKDIVHDISCARITMSSYDNNGNQGNVLTEVLNYPLWVSVLPQENTKMGINLFWIPELQLSKNSQPYLYSSPSSWTVTIDEKYPDKLIESNPFILQDNGYTVDNHSKVIAAKITGSLKGLYSDFESKASNIIVIPDQYFMNSLMNEYIGDTKNFFYLTNELLKLNGELELAEMQNRASMDKTLYKITNNDDLIKYKTITYLVVFFIIPFILILIEVTILILQRRKMKYVKKQWNQ